MKSLKKRSGGQPGNQNARKRKVERAKSVTFRLYQENLEDLAFLATRWGVSATDALRRALREAALDEQ
jgi:hypothetical protein